MTPFELPGRERAERRAAAKPARMPMVRRSAHSLHEALS
jgi:hypothetical protein